MNFRAAGALLLACVMLALAGPAVAQPAAEDLVISQNGEEVGHVRAERSGDRITVDYLVDNNGRGPRHREEIVIGPNQIPVAYAIEGRSLMGAPVTESYRWADGRAVWRSQADHGDVAAPQPPLYIVNDNSPYALAVYARALLADPDGRIDVLPAGQLGIEKVRDLDIGSGDRRIAVSIYRIDGIDLAPDYVVLDRDNRLFAAGGAIRRGWQSEARALQRIYADLGAERSAAIQQRIAHRFEGPVRIRNVRIFQPREGNLSEPSTVVVMGERIAQILPGVEQGPAPAGQAVIEGEGGTLVSGLHDMHAHLNTRSSLFYLAAGVTSIRDQGNRNASLLRLERRIAGGEVAGPSIVRNGFIEARSPFSARTGTLVESEAEALEAVRWYADRGYHQIKIYNSMNPAWVPAIAREAHRRGLGVTGHIPAFTNPDEMIRAGYDEIAHINQLMLGWLIEPGEDTRTPLRLTAMARAADLDLASPRVQETVRLMSERNIAQDTTAVILERLMLSRAGTVAEGDAPYLDHMPIGYQRYRRRTFVPLASPEADAAYREAFDRIVETLGLLHRNGIRLLPGTDDGTGFTVHRELELYVRAGISPAETLRIATLGMEEYMGRAHDYGSIERGKFADFFLVAGDPTRDISTVRRARMVMRGGVLYFPSEIYDALGIRPFAEPPRLVPATPERESGGEDEMGAAFSHEEEMLR